MGSWCWCGHHGGHTADAIIWFDLLSPTAGFHVVADIIKKLEWKCCNSCERRYSQISSIKRYVLRIMNPKQTRTPPLDAVCLSVTRSPRENEPDQTSGLLDELEMGGARRGHVGGWNCGQATERLVWRQGQETTRARERPGNVGGGSSGGGGGWCTIICIFFKVEFTIIE